MTSQHVGARRRRNKVRESLLAIVAWAVFGSSIAPAQTQDSSQNSLLNGTFQFRHLAVLNIDANGDPSEIAATNGTITFTPAAGTYKIVATTLDNTVSTGAQPLNVSGTYAIGSNGVGYISNPLFPADPNAYINGAVAQGVFTGSSTESELEEAIVNDIFIAMPAGSPTNGSFTTPYQTGLLDFANANASAIKNALFELTPNGQGGFGPINLNGQASNQSSASVSQTVTGATYNFSGGVGTLTLPLPARLSSADALFTGSKTMFQSKDGNFILGWTAGGYDIFFGIKALTITGTNAATGGLYFTAALEDYAGFFGTDSYYGSTSDSGDSAGDGIVHQRVNSPFGPSYDYGTDNLIVPNSDGTTSSPDFDGYVYVFGDAGSCQTGAALFPCALGFVAIGTNGYYSLVVGLHAPIFSGTGVYLNPVGVVNAASYAPITASIAPGELITLFGTGLTSVTMITPGGQNFQTSLGGVIVTINGIPCPIYYVDKDAVPQQIAVVVPYAVASNQTGLANIQVTNGVASNIVQMYLTDAAPGAFAQNEEGIGYADARHAATGAQVTPQNPAQPGEYISLFLSGLGTVTPTIQDGSLGPSVNYSYSDLYNAGNLGAFFNDYGPNGGSTGILANMNFAGLAPGFVGLYQVNVQIPDSGLGAGDNVYIQFVTDAADVNQIQIPYGFSSAARVATATPALARVRASRAPPAKRLRLRK